ncbi:hypothetical protein C3L33_20961, partial [Rhododendron williamsianum]
MTSHTASPTTYPCTTPGGIRFTNEIGFEYSQQTLISVTEFTWSLFKQNSEADRRTTPKLSLFIETLGAGQVAFSSNDEIRVNADYIQGFSGDVRKEITGILYHEVVHSWQWNGNGQTPAGLIEVIADFVRLKAEYAKNWRQPGSGNRWDEGYQVTALFLDYCNGLKNGFVAELNKKMRTGALCPYAAPREVEVGSGNVKGTCYLEPECEIPQHNLSYQTK